MKYLNNNNTISIIIMNEICHMRVHCVTTYNIYNYNLWDTYGISKLYQFQVHKLELVL